MSHDNAPATILLSTNCACCGRALVDAPSVECGVGPDCRERHGFDTAQTEPHWVAARELADAVLSPMAGTNFAILSDPDSFRAVVRSIEAQTDARGIVNTLVHLVAKERDALAPHIARAIFSMIGALGFTTLAARIAKRWRDSIDVPANVCTIHDDCKTDDGLSRACKAAQKVEDAKRGVRTMIVAVPASPVLADARAEYARVRGLFCYDNCTQIEFTSLVREENPSTPEEWVAAAKRVTCTCKSCSGSGTFRGVINGTCFRCGGKGKQDMADVLRNRGWDRRNSARRNAAV